MICAKLAKLLDKLSWRSYAAIGLSVSSMLNPIAALSQTTPATGQNSNQSLRPRLFNQAAYEYSEENSRLKFQTSTSQLSSQVRSLVDPLGRILDCNGTVLSDYSGFSVAVFELNPADPTGTELGNLADLTTTELPDIPGNSVPGGLAPNRTNQNPFQLSNAVPENERGSYNFLLDPNKGQLNAGRSYILVLNPPSGSVYQQRRVKITILESTGQVGNGVVRYVARALDGQPLRLTGDLTFEDTVVFVPNAETVGLDLLSLQLTTWMCQPNQVEIVKSADRAVSEPGDTAIYRLSVRNRADVPLTGVQLSDVLPVGFKFLPNSVRGEVDNQLVPVIAEANGSTINFSTTADIPPDRILNVAYAVQLSSDAMRGSGLNSVIVNAQRLDNGLRVKDGPATHQMRVNPGLLSDCGVVIGRVFDDLNFDGEQQPGEPGIPNAVIFLDDGNRITTDADGMFSIVNVLSGYRTGVLDLTSVPGYTLAPNQKFKERRSQSRLVRLAPGSLVRMNFAVTPALESSGGES